MTLSPWLALLLGVPVLLCGEAVIRRVALLRRFHLPAPVVGGLLAALVVLAVNLAAGGDVRFGLRVTERWWSWLVTVEPRWLEGPAINVTLPPMAVFFTCVGLNASWEIVRKGSVQVLLFLGLATALAVVQNLAGWGLARALGESPLLGLVCGSVSMTGGHGTSLGFADLLEKAGLPQAGLLGAAASTVGLVTGALAGGPIAAWLLRGVSAPGAEVPAVAGPGGSSAGAGYLGQLGQAWRGGRGFIAQLLVVLACVKAGAWVSHAIQLTGIAFSAQIGAMIVGVVVRNALDAAGWRIVRGDTLGVISALSLGFFLSVAMLSMNLIELAAVARPMLVLLAAQVVVMAAFAVLVTYRCMGRDYEAAVMATGHGGFGLGNTATAVALMQSVVDRHGPAPRAFLVVPLVGAILIDFTNALVTTLFINLAR